MVDYPAWGVHVAAASVRAVKLEEEDDGSVRVLAHEHIDFTEDVEDIHSLDRINALARALTIFRKRHDLGEARVVVTFDGVTAFNRFVQAPMSSPDGMSRLIEYEAKHHIPYDLEQVYWDHKVLSVNDHDNMVEAMVLAIKKDIVDDRLRKMQKMNVPVDAAQVAPAALYNYAAFEGLNKDGTLLLAVDYDRVDLVFCNHGRLWFRTYPDGVAAMMRRVHKDLQPRHRLAIKTVHGSHPADDPALLETIRREYADGLAAEVAGLIRYYEGARTDSKVTSIVLLPGTFLVPLMLPQALHRATGLEVKDVKDFRRLKIDPGIVTPDLEWGVGLYAHAAGAALQGLGRAEVMTKLYPAASERVITGRRILWVASVLVAFLTVAAIWWESSRSGRSVATAHKSLDESIARAERSIERFKSKQVEATLKDVVYQYADHGKNRLLSVSAVDAVLRTVDRLNQEKKPDDRLYVVALETKRIAVDPAAENDWRSRRKVEFTLAKVALSSDDEMRAFYEKETAAAFRSVAGVVDAAVRSTFSAPVPSTTGAPLPEGSRLRRKFVMARFEIVFEDAPGKKG